MNYDSLILGADNNLTWLVSPLSPSYYPNNKLTVLTLTILKQGGLSPARLDTLPPEANYSNNNPDLCY